MSSVPYIGSQISLISKSDIRYEGTLHTIDPNEHTVSLSNVKSFGTEGRRGNGKEIPASAEIYEFIIFRGSDIKDLTVIQANSQQSDPAIINSSKPISEPQPKPAPQRNYNNNYNPNYVPRDTRRGNYGELNGNINEDLKAEVEEDFDFESITIDRDQKTEEKEKCYNKKSSFFDSISCKAAENAENRLDRDRQKELDRETFGDDSVDSGERDLRRYIRGGRRRGRGGYRNDRGNGDSRGYRGGGGQRGDYRGENRGYRGRGYRGYDREQGGDYSGNRGYGREQGGEYSGNRGYNREQGGDYRGNRGYGREQGEEFRGNRGYGRGQGEEYRGNRSYGREQGDEGGNRGGYRGYRETREFN